MAEYSSGAIYFTGLGSEIDFDSIITATVNAAGYRKTQLTSWKESWETKIEALQELNTALLDLRTALKGLDSSAEFLTKTVSSSDSSAASATASGDAETGAHTVVVGQLAQNDVWVNTATGFSGAADTVTASDASFTFSYGGTQYTVAVAAGTTLQGLASLITNNPGSRGDVKAVLVNNGSAYHLEIYGMDQGAKNAVTVVSSTVAGFAPEDFAHTQTAQNARFKVDGYPPGADDWIERASNTVSDVLDGLTLTLSGAGETRLAVSLETDAMQETIEEFVAQMNTVRSLVQSLTAVTSSDDSATGSALTGNYGVNLVASRLKSITAAAGLGFTAYAAATGRGDAYSALSQIGISTDTSTSSSTYGQLVIDDLTLAEALENDPEAVASLFVADYEGESASGDFSFLSCVKGTTQPGEHEISYVISGGVLVSASVDGEPAVVEGWEITASPGAAAQGLAVRVDNRADGSYTGGASVKQGKIGQLVDALAEITDTSTGTLNIILDNYETIVSNAEDKISQEEARLTRLETFLRERYAALESTLSTYQGMLDTLDTYLEALDS